MFLGALELLLVLLVMLGAIVLVGTVVVNASRRPPVPPAPQPPALPEPDPVLVRVKDLAWDHRELDTPLADALIEYLNQHESNPDQRFVRNQVGEIAWQHRDTCPDLSVLVIDLLRHAR